MQNLRKTTVGLTASILLILLIIFGVAFGVQRVFSTPTPIKSSLKDSGLYDNIVANILEQTQKTNQNQEQGQEGENEIPIDRPEVQSIIKNAASPEYLQTQTEGVLDSVYAWLQGKTPSLSFEIDLTEVKTRLADGVGQYVAEHTASLPVCTGGSAPSDSENPFNATCRPPGSNADQMAAEAKDQILNGEFLKESKITADSIKTGEGDKTLSQQLDSVPATYRKLNWVVYGLGILAVLLAVAIIFLSADKRSGCKKLSIIAISAGAIITVIGWGGSFGLQRGGSMLTEPIQQSAVKAAELLANDLRSWWMGYGIVLIVLGIGTLLALHFTKPKLAPEHENPAKPTDESTPELTEPAGAKTETTPKQKPEPVKKLVQ